MTESRYPLDPLDFAGVTTYPLASRSSKVSVDQFAIPCARGDTVSTFIDKLPRILAADALRDLVSAIARARTSGRMLLWGMGGHVIKCGLGAIVIDMMRDGLVSGIAMNGAAMIHDFEIAVAGSTSEEVPSELGSGRFGMAGETGEYLNQAVNDGHQRGLGIGESVGVFLAAGEGGRFDCLDRSVLHEAYIRSIPVTVHLAIGTDITHIHPQASGEHLGGASMIDFKLLCSMVRQLQHGVYTNLGSAVILPEVFLKAVSVVRNLGTELNALTTANMDFIQHYRPTHNVLLRPTMNGGRSIALTGHHEIMLPLLAAALKDAVIPQ